MSLVVTGISQDGSLAGLETALKGAGFSLDPISIVAPDDSEESLSNFHGGASIDTHLLVGGGQGTGVPGLTDRRDRTSIGRRTDYFRNQSLATRLSNFEIPDSEMDNYLEALAAGRYVVAYFAHKPENVGNLEELFRTAGMSKVKTF
ncbi:MAG: hypothetical protein JOY59_00085 [Candidatus Eremiobacteraeota bacterium]|nr:hypothetical protein [Candidatus Eremiobacteraeota bacterium]